MKRKLDHTLFNSSIMLLAFISLLYNLANCSSGVPSHFALEISKHPLDQILDGIVRLNIIENEILPTQESRTIVIGNITLPSSDPSSGGTLLYNVSCLLVNVSDIRFNTSFIQENNNALINVTKVSGVCFGLYEYRLSIFGSERVISDKWNMTID